MGWNNHTLRNSLSLIHAPSLVIRVEGRMACRVRRYIVIERRKTLIILLKAVLTRSLDHIIRVSLIWVVALMILAMSPTCVSTMRSASRVRTLYFLSCDFTNYLPIFWFNKGPICGCFCIHHYHLVLDKRKLCLVDLIVDNQLYFSLRLL